MIIDHVTAYITRQILNFFSTKLRFNSQMRENTFNDKKLVGITTTSKLNIFQTCLENIKAMYISFKYFYVPLNILRLLVWC